MNVPEGLLYSADHEWVRADGTTITIGITDYAQDALGDVVYVSLPTVGATVAGGDSFSEIESTKSVSDIYAPVAGTVAAANEQLGDRPQLINEDPYGEGWLCRMELDDPTQLESLMDHQAYRALVEG